MVAASAVRAPRQVARSPSSMRKLFYLGALGLLCFELANVYFIMPLPYSQRMRSVDLAYRLHEWRWAFRLAFGAAMLAGLWPAWRARAGRRLVPASLLVAGGVAYVANARMAADRIFVAPAALDMQPAARSVVEPARLVVGVE